MIKDKIKITCEFSVEIEKIDLIPELIKRLNREFLPIRKLKSKTNIETEKGGYSFFLSEIKFHD